MLLDIKSSLRGRLESNEMDSALTAADYLSDSRH